MGGSGQDARKATVIFVRAIARFASGCRRRVTWHLPARPLARPAPAGSAPGERCGGCKAFVLPMHTTMPGSPCRVLWLKFIAKFIEKLMRKAAKYWLWEENTTHLEWGGKCSNNLATIDLALSMYWSSFYNINLHLQSAAEGTDFIPWPR